MSDPTNGDTHLPNKQALAALSAAQRHPDSNAWERAAEQFFDSEAAINVVHPINELTGHRGYTSGYIAKLVAAFDGVYRRDGILMGGSFADDDTGEMSNWVSATGHWCGHFHNDLFGIKATGRLTFLRFGEFHRMENGKAVESYIFLDLPELMIATDQWPIADGPGKM